MATAPRAMNLVPAEWMPAANMKRIICHWTAGGHKASALDRQHYHILIEDDGDLVRGRYSIKDNESTKDGVYAAHTRRANTGSIGVAVCCMAGADRNPFVCGPYPMTKRQWDVMAMVVAELSRRYDIPVRPDTILGHGEVQQTLRIKQMGKWDPMVLPWNPRISDSKVGDMLRGAVKAILGDVAADSAVDSDGEDETPPSLEAVINGVPVPGAVSYDESAYLKLSSLVRALRWEIVGADTDMVVLTMGAGNPDLAYLGYLFLDGREVDDDDTEDTIVRAVQSSAYVSAMQVARVLGLPIAFDFDAETLVIGRAASNAAGNPAGSRPASVTVKAGETLFRIAERHLGNGNRWRLLRKADGTPYTDADLPHIRIGEVVLLPDAAVSDKDDGRRPAGTAGLNTERLIEAAAPEIRSYARASIPIILAECQANGVTHPAQVAYILATSEHESKCGRFMSEIWGPTAAQAGYEGRHDLGNTQRGDGYRFRGRGYVQVTGRRNYEVWKAKLGVDIVARPDIVSRDPVIAAAILVRGMKDGAFRGRRLEQYVSDVRVDFFNARDVINGDKNFLDRGYSKDRGTRIAEIAERYLAALSS